MVAGAGIKDDYKDLMAKLVCSLANEACMFGSCNSCPTDEALVEYLQGVLEDDVVSFSEWKHTDRTYMAHIELHSVDFTDQLVKMLKELCSHHYIAKAQAEFFKSCKSNLKIDECLVTLDFAENLKLTIQHEVQGNYFGNGDDKYVTLHPFVLYYKNVSQEENGLLEHKSYCVLSDAMSHDSTAVYAFLSRLLVEIKEFLPGVRSVKYFSDGAASQYKNRFNMGNLSKHYSDFGIQAEWHFFASCHGKGANDGIGGTIKRMARTESLKREFVNQILCVDSLFNFLKNTATKIECLLVKQLDIERVASEVNLNDRFSLCSPLHGIRSNHCFSVKSQGVITAKKISSLTSITPPHDHVVLPLRLARVEYNSISTKDWVACCYGGNWWLAMVESKDENKKTFYLDFLHPHGPATSFKWPARKDKLIVSVNEIVMVVPEPRKRTKSSRNLEMTGDMLTIINQAFDEFKLLQEVFDENCDD